MISRATMFATLIIGLMAGPAVSLNGSPTVSPVTAAAWASEPLPPKAPSSISFFALSHAPPPEVIAIARKRPVTIVPISRPPSIGVDGELGVLDPRMRRELPRRVHVRLFVADESEH